MVKPYLSIVIPLYNETGNVVELHRRITQVMEKTGRDYELILVDDGSRDDTHEKISALQRSDKRVVTIRLGKNYGQSIALAAGVDNSEGEIIMFMDGDLQHDPDDIPLFLAKLDEGYDVVSGWRKNRVDDYFTRRLPSRLANWLIAKVSGVKLNDFGTTFKAYRKEIIKSIRLYSNFHRYIPALTSWTGATICEIPINNILRVNGNSNYGLRRTFKVAIDLLALKFILNYTSRPLYMFGVIGVILIGLGTAAISYLSIAWLFFGLNMLENRGFLLLAVLFDVTGVQIFTTGLISELVSRTYYESQGKRPYFVKAIKSSRPANPGAA